MRASSHLRAREILDCRGNPTVEAKNKSPQKYPLGISTSVLEIDR